MKQVLIIHPDGTIETVYSDHLRELELGPQQMTRASIVDFDKKTQEWVAWVFATGEVLVRDSDRATVDRKEREILMERLLTEKSDPMVFKSGVNLPKEPGNVTQS